MTNDNYLKAFILYCQSIETIYNEWKNYWINILTTKETSTHHDPSKYLEMIGKIYKYDNLY